MPGNNGGNKETVPWGFLLAVILAELLTAIGYGSIGLILYYILLIVIFIQAMRICMIVDDEDIQQTVDASPAGRNVLKVRYRLNLALMLFFLIRVVGLPLFLADLSISYLLLLAGVLLFTAAFFIIRSAGYRAQDIYLTFSSPILYFLTLQLIIGVSGIPLGLIEKKLLPVTTALFPPQVQYGEAVFILFCFSGFLEELIFRGVLLRAAGDYMGVIGGSLYVSCLFAALQISQLLFLGVIYAFLVSLFFCWIVRRTGSIWGVTIAHGLMNMLLYLPS
jgi:membrane protease YdiL (CAAX protease family)